MYTPEIQRFRLSRSSGIGTLTRPHLGLTLGSAKITLGHAALEIFPFHEYLNLLLGSFSRQRSAARQS